MNFREIFAKQIKSNKPCNGDYLNGKTFAEVVNDRYLSYSMETFGHINQNELKNDIAQSVANKIAEYFIHKDEYLVMLLVVEEENYRALVKYHKLWESNWDDFSSRYELIDTTHEFPRFKKIDTI